MNTNFEFPYRVISWCSVGHCLA